jgi:DNA-directed RNA polymerase specialized sigma24 family protein
VERLPDKLRRVFELHVKQGVTVEETARTLGTVERTIYNRLERIKQLLLACLD